MQGSRYVFLCLIFLLIKIVGLIDENKAQTEVITLGTDRYLFIDDILIDWTRSFGVGAVVNPPFIADRVIVPDMPWENMGYHYYSQVMPYGRVYEGQVYNYILYYRRLSAVYNEEDEESGDGLYCVALSNDGIYWIKPIFTNSVVFAGQSTNCLEDGNEFISFVLFDPNGNEQNRYKAIGHLYNGAFGVVGVSADGLVFQPVSKRLGPIHEDGYVYGGRPRISVMSFWCEAVAPISTGCNGPMPPGPSITAP